MRIVFMGTPDFAAASLKALIETQHQIVGVVTQPDKPKGRGKQVQPPPVKVLALENSLPVYQPVSIKTDEFLEQLKLLQPQCIVVVAYGKILPREILHLPPLGCVNVHASLLPYYRGAAPIHWAVINGEKETGVTTMYMDEGMDTGDMILKGTIPIGPDDTVGMIHDRLAAQGAKLLVETLGLMGQGKAPRQSQNHTSATYAPMLRKEHEPIDWQGQAKDIHNHVRGMDPWPGAFTTWEGQVLKIWKTGVPAPLMLSACPGTVLELQTGGILVQTGYGQILIKELQLQGSKRMEASRFLRGKQITPGTVLGQ
ncbi:methionyl-tRNA formyltransferase [Desulforamulus aquiferis]|uniref:Methionyl-tRNA formyltransferase n=1 Tax=Desulforamulus aquiferis TaxID=1397668 RepID=A0AAW7ZA10_9FIRM|nr:methionyl-tRNA formyltransferase [Desulforamulus aquiferis]MDO7786192.1 methionyl-tRNA formyltransferase [Desulforamulus aquiferis]